MHDLCINVLRLSYYTIETSGGTGSVSDSKDRAEIQPDWGWRLLSSKRQAIKAFSQDQVHA